jgi:VCBS repeat protein/EF hand domain-containing protein
VIAPKGAGAMLGLLLAAGCAGTSTTTSPTPTSGPIGTAVAGSPAPATSHVPPTPTARPGPPFTFAQVIDVPPTPLVGSIAIADLDGDGTADLLVCNDALPSVSVIKGKPDGTFLAARAVDIGTSCISVTAADLNGDAILDLATVNPDGTATVVLARADGSFGKPVGYIVTGDLAPAPAWTIATGDLNGDGALDLIATVFNFDLGFAAPGQLAVLLNGAKGTFRAPVFYPDRGAVAVATADMNGDGRIDVVSASGDSTARVFLGDGTGALGTATEYPLTGAGVALSIVDLNRDGFLDLATGDDAASAVNVLLANSDGTFAKAQRFAAGNTHTIAVVDLDRDGHLDLLAGAYTETFVRLWYGLGDGAFSREARIDTGAPSVFAIVAHDFNGDGHVDLAIADGVSAIRILLG